jgi:hypothetical protein
LIHLCFEGPSAFARNLCSDIDDSVIDDAELMQNNSEDSSDESDSDYSDDSLSTISSSIGRRQFLVRRPVSPEIDDDSCISDNKTESSSHSNAAQKSSNEKGESLNIIL